MVDFLFSTDNCEIVVSYKAEGTKKKDERFHTYYFRMWGANRGNNNTNRSTMIIDDEIQFQKQLVQKNDTLQSTTRSFSGIVLTIVYYYYYYCSYY